LFVLLVASGSIVPEVAVAESQIWPTAECHDTVTDTVTLPPSGIDAHVQITFFPEATQVPPPLATMFGGGVPKKLELIVSVTFWLSLGPLFVSVTVNVPVPFPGDPVFDIVCVTARSATALTVPQTLDASLIDTGSGVELLNDAVLQS
jgi:hypothetical protein